MRIERGDGWELRCGDCLDPEMGLASLEAVDHVITDPPYEKEAHTKARRTKPLGRGDGDPFAYEIPFAPLTEEERASFAKAAFGMSRGWCLAFCQVEAVAAWRAVFPAKAWRRAMCWIKPDGTPQLTGDRPAQGFECIAAVWCGPGKSRWNSGGKRGFYTCNVNGFGRIARLHPTEKPVRLMSEIVLDFTEPGALICDPFAGSGTTGVAALKHGRRFIGWEKDPDFFDVAVRRLQGRPAKVEGQEELFG